MIYFLKKIFYSLSVLLGVAVLVFILFQALGDPVKLIAGQTGDKKTMDNIRKDLYLDQSLGKQLIHYLNDLSPISVYSKSAIEQKNIKGYFVGNVTQIGLKLPYLGRSYQSKKNVTAIISEVLPGTIVLAITAMLFACIIGIAIGILAALYKNTWIDKVAVFLGIIGISVPSFFSAIIIAYFFGWVLHAYTGLSITGSLYSMDEITGEKYIELKNLILPAFTLGIRPLAMISQLTRSSMLEVLQQDFIRTAYAKGLKKRTIIFKHALRNALNPVITAVTGWFAELLAGAFFIEFIFGWKGLGKTTVDALEKLDYPVVMGSILCSALLFIFINMLTDFLYRKVDPRIN